MPEESTPAPPEPPPGPPSGPADPTADGSNFQDVMEGIMGLHKRIYELEKSLVTGGVARVPDLKLLGPELRRTFVPAWRRETPGEPRWHIVLAVTAAMFLQWPLPGRLVLIRPTLHLPA